MRDDREYLNHIRVAIERIMSYTHNGTAKAEFMASTLIQDAVVRNLEIIGEAARNISDSTRNAFPTVPWMKMIGMRNVLIHHYFGVVEETVWSVIEKDLPAVLRDIEVILMQR